MRNLKAQWEDAVSVAGVRRRQTEVLLRHWEGARDAASAESATAVILADFNQPLECHHDEEEWAVVAAGLSSKHVAQPLVDGVADLLNASGFRSAYNSAACNNFGGRAAPPFTHWTGTTVDFAYVHGSSWRVAGAYVQNTPVSDHLPVVLDLVSNEK